MATNKQTALKDERNKNSLSVERAGSTGGGTAQAASANAPSFEYKGYQPSGAVQQAQDMLNQQMAQKPGAYQSRWQTQLNDTLNKILNREKFSYDLNGDALYQQYKDQYALQGQMAMMNTMGQAQAMTGGYGNSYAQSVGQQAYQSHLQGLNDIVPELYQLAMSKYQMEGDDLNTRLAMLAQQEEQAYGRYRDQVGDWQSERDFLTGRYDAERDYDYGKWADERDFSYGQHRDAVADQQWQSQFDEAQRQYNEGFQYQKDRDSVADQQWQREFDEAMRQYNESFQYQQDRDAVSDSQWQAEFDEAKRQYDQDYALSKARSGSGSGGSGGSGKGAAETADPYADADLEAMIRGAGGRAQVEAMIENMAQYGYDKDALWALYEQLYLKGGDGRDVVPTTPVIKNRPSYIAY